MRKRFSDKKKAAMKGLLDAGESEVAVAEVFNCSRWMVHKVREQMESDLKFVKWYKENRGNILAKVQMDNLALHEAIVTGITERDIKGMTMNERASWVRNTAVNAGIMYDKERLENDLSTENISERLKVIMAIKEEDGEG